MYKVLNMWYWQYAVLYASSETLQCEMQVRVVHMPSDKGLVQQPSSALSRMLRVQVW